MVGSIWNGKTNEKTKEYKTSLEETVLEEFFLMNVLDDLLEH